MPDRLNKIVTRGGDKGETSLGDGARVAKDDPRVILLGDIDELNAWIGVCLAHLEDGEVAQILTGVQHDLFDLGGALCFPGATALSAAHVNRLDDAAGRLNSDLAPLKEFILPGGSPLLAWMHVARTTCRRTERAMAAFARIHEEAGAGLQYLNRLSDVLFIAARYEAKRGGIAETLWRKEISLSN